MAQFKTDTIAASQTPWLSDINAASFKLNSAGNVGIGAVAGSSRLTVSATGSSFALFYAIDTSSTALPTFQVSNDTGPSLYFGVGGSAYTVTNQRSNAYVRADNDLLFKTGGSAAEIMRVTAGGNVGIGTPGPRGTLSVIAATNPTTVANATQILVGEVTNSTGYGLTIGYLFDAGTTFKGAIQNYHGGTGNALLLNPLGGNVGIGTGSPTARLHIVGLSVYASDAAAGTAGLTGGAVYLDSTGVLHIKL